MGIGRLGNSDLVFKRKFRWTLRWEGFCNGRKVPEHFVKLAARPSLTIEETEINFLNAKTWIPGKGTWETITVTYYDVNTQDNIDLYTWLAAVYDFARPGQLNQGRRSDYAAIGTLTLYDGCGASMEEWKLKDAWPQSINFGDLDYSNSEEVTIELTIRYSQVEYTSLCPKRDIPVCCTPCQ